MNYKIGDIVVHWTYGLGTIVAIEQKDLAGVKQQYYVVEVESFKLWAPVEEADERTIRFPTGRIQFEALFDILRSAGEELPENQYQRKTTLRERMQKRSLAGVCHVIRDLSYRSRQHALNQNDSSILLLAEKHLLDEWAFSLGVERANALREMEVLLRADPLELAELLP